MYPDLTVIKGEECEQIFETTLKKLDKIFSFVEMILTSITIVKDPSFQ